MNPRYYSILLIFGLFTFVCLQFLFHPGQVLAHSTPKVDKPQIQVYLDEKKLSFSPSPYLKQNHTLVPVRDFLTALGVDVQWNPSKKTITASKHGKQLILEISSRQAKVNGLPISLPIPAQLTTQGKAFAPLRVLAEAFDAKVDWHTADRSVHIMKIDTVLSHQEAENLIRIYLNNPQDSSLIIEYDHTDEDGAYVIHAYDWVQSKDRPSMTVTQGWYKVHSASGKIQSLFE